jgi:hypothetical protein
MIHTITVQVDHDQLLRLHEALARAGRRQDAIASSRARVARVGGNRPLSPAVADADDLLAKTLFD